MFGHKVLWFGALDGSCYAFSVLKFSTYAENSNPPHRLLKLLEKWDAIFKGSLSASEGWPLRIKLCSQKLDKQNISLIKLSLLFIFWNKLNLMQFPLTYYFAIRQNVLSSNRTYVLLCILSVYIILVSENKSHIVEFSSFRHL